MGLGVDQPGHLCRVFAQYGMRIVAWRALGQIGLLPTRVLDRSRVDADSSVAVRRQPVRREAAGGTSVFPLQFQLAVGLDLRAAQQRSVRNRQQVERALAGLRVKTTRAPGACRGATR